jgi:hypothetical protein
LDGLDAFDAPGEDESLQVDITLPIYERTLTGCGRNLTRRRLLFSTPKTMMPFVITNIMMARRMRQKPIPTRTSSPNGEASTFKMRSFCPLTQPQSVLTQDLLWVSAIYQGFAQMSIERDVLEAGRYVPPALRERKPDGDDTPDSEEIMKLKRNMKGLLNRSALTDR